MFDTCANQDNLTNAKEAACGSLEVLAADCASKGKRVDWRKAAGCPLTCPAGSNMVYKFQTSACIPSCANPTADKACGLPDTESCTCESGLLLWKGKCVKPEECGCHHSGNYYSIGDTWSSSDCSVEFSCVACERCAYPIGQVVNTTSSCADNEVCMMVNSTYGCHQNSVDGEWGAWGSWGRCVGGSCSSGKESRRRQCDSPAPSRGGLPCKGDSEESRVCNCTDGNWGAWGSWSSCVAGSCSTGKESRRRQCDSPAPSNGGLPCKGDSEESRECKCTDGSWGLWSSWSDCIGESCIAGKEVRRRLCNNPAPFNGGQPCSGDDQESRACGCVDGGWSVWSDWTSCNGMCNAWTHERQRRCDNPSPKNGGKDCDGDSTQSQSCKCGLPFNATVECAKCEDIVNGVGYLPDLCDCQSYYQCEENNGVWRSHNRKCSKCTQWNQEDLTCGIVIPDCTDDDGEDNTETVPVIVKDTCIKDGQIRKMHTNKLKYIWVVDTRTYDMPCAPKTSFDFEKCDCTHDDTHVIPEPKALLCLPFDKGFLAGTGWGWVGAYGVSTRKSTTDNEYALFEGAGHLEIPRFTNNVPQNGFSISFWFKRTGGSSGEQGLVTNNCIGENSIEITSASQTTLSAKVKTVDEDGAVHFGSVSVTTVSPNKWHHVVYSYDGEYLSVYVDKVNYVSAYTPGKIFNTQCPMTVGLKVNAHFKKYFTGYMDELCFHDGPKSDAAVAQLYADEVAERAD